ncbi:hypothetical protein HPB47_001664 [Ixodes persulcatus]|uniref:Uncharacterized protein n=1 Tax=Ixodes persulcatus TaxID=34615 RepID=A0AC60PNQ6_IXOPE|nr:hypothetical protein HPB47_001664 [Ixodes persulcatus]
MGVTSSELGGYAAVSKAHVVDVAFAWGDVVAAAAAADGGDGVTPPCSIGLLGRFSSAADLAPPSCHAVWLPFTSGHRKV